MRGSGDCVHLACIQTEGSTLNAMFCNLYGLRADQHQTMGSHLLESSTQQLLFGLVVLVVSWLVLRWRRQTAKLPPGTRRPPCLPSVPVLGSLPFMVNNLDTTHVYLMKKGKTLGNVFGFYLGSRYIPRLGQNFTTVR